MTIEKHCVTVSPEMLREFCAAILRGAGVPHDEAKIVAESLVDADCAGLASHGVSRLSDYLRRLDDGLVAASTKLTMVCETAATALLDAGNGWGQVASAAAVNVCIDKARKTGIACVTVRNSNHNGTAAFWTRRLAKAGMIGISGTNGSPVMAPFGSLEESLGTNPISISAPSPGSAPIILDMATSAQARGKIIVAKKNNESIPEGWALTRDGRPTTDAQEALDGVLLPMAGAKGSGMAMMIDILCGVLSGANFGADVPRMYVDKAPQRLGHFFIGLNVESMMPMADFLARMAIRESQTRMSRPIPGFDAVRMPGDVEHIRIANAERDGAPMPGGVYDELVATAQRYGIDAATYLKP